MTPSNHLGRGGIIPPGRLLLPDGCVWPPRPTRQIEVHFSGVLSEDQLVECIRKALRSRNKEDI